MVTPRSSALAAPPQRPVLRRGLKVLGTLLITLSAITPASSVFIIAPGVIAIAGTGAFWSYLAAGVVGIFMAFVYAELSSAYPLTGGEYAIVGRTLGRLPGFMMLGMMLITQMLILAVIALGVGIYLGVIFPGLHVPTTAAVTVLASAVLAVLNIKLNAVVTGIFLAVEMLTLVVVAGLGFVNVERPFTELFAHPVVPSDGAGLTAASVGLIAAATAVSIFSYNGYGSAVYFGEETQGASRNIARTILWALVITVAAEAIPITAVLLGAPSLTELFAAERMMEYFVTARGGAAMNTFVSLGIAVAIINAVIAIMLLSARMLFSTGRDQAWPRPISNALTMVHPRLGTPWVATAVAAALAAAACFVKEQLLLVITGTSLVIVYAALCVAVLNGRRNGTTRHGAYRMPLFPLPPLVALAALGYVIYQNALDPAFGRPSLLIAIAVLAAAGVYYLALVRRRGTWILRGPEEDGSSS